MYVTSASQSIYCDVVYSPLSFAAVGKHSDKTVATRNPLWFSGMLSGQQSGQRVQYLQEKFNKDKVTALFPPGWLYSSCRRKNKEEKAIRETPSQVFSEEDLKYYSSEIVRVYCTAKILDVTAVEKALKQRLTYLQEVGQRLSLISRLLKFKWLADTLNVQKVRMIINRRHSEIEQMNRFRVQSLPLFFFFFLLVFTWVGGVLCLWKYVSVLLPVSLSLSHIANRNEVFIRENENTYYC